MMRQMVLYSISGDRRRTDTYTIFFVLTHLLHDVRGLNDNRRTEHVHYEPGSSVSLVSDYGLDDRAIGVRSPAEAKGFVL
jgi:hypothetical protein